MENVESNELMFNELVRPFAAGSRQTPDPYDRFLDDNGFYRKHTARDASSLFRVISEQVYEIQAYHERVRSELVDFMYANREHFEPTITCMGHDFDIYLADVSKPRTRGTVLELKAAGMLYDRNVMLFEPLTTGRWLNRPRDMSTGMIRVFFTAPIHFDTVYPKEYMKKAAYCQAIVYEILYKEVFKLPDVDYAVEKMLHDPFNENIRVEENNAGQQTVTTGDGRQIGFDTAKSTQCLLGDYRFCHFHNVEGFGTEISKYMQNGKANKKKPHLDLFLYDEKISCVRQLLEDGVTPFPYKVAKALDQSIYRNVEYDTWAEARRERKFRDWYFGGSDFKVGVKCLLKRYDATDGYAICHIQEMSVDKYECIVFIEGTGELVNVPCSALRALPREQCSWGVPIKRWRPRYTAPPPSEQQPKYIEYCKRDENKMYPIINQYASIEFFQPPPQHFIAMPLIKQEQPQHEVKPDEPKHDVEQPIDEMCDQVAQVDSGYVTEFNNTGSTQAYNAYETPTGQFPMPTAPQVPQGIFQPYLVPAPYPYQVGTNQLWANEMQYPSPSVTPSRMGAVNFSARPSTQADGGDLPIQDIATLRYFYNMGIDAYNRRVALSGDGSPDPEQNNQIDSKASDQSSHEPKPQQEQDVPQHFRGRRDYGYGGQRRGRGGRSRGRGNGRGNGRNGEMYRFFDNKDRGHSPMRQGDFQNDMQHGTPNMAFPPPPHPPQQHFNEYDQHQFIPYVQPQFVQPTFYPYQVMPQMPASLSAQHSNSSMMDYQQNVEIQEPQPGCLWYPPNPQMGFYVMPPPHQQQYIPAPQQYPPPVFPADGNNNPNNSA